jgi:hypothetical protein
MKKWYQSRTVVMNIIAGLLGVLPLIDNGFLLAIGITNVQGYLSILGVVTTVLNLILRTMTTTVIETKKRALESMEYDFGGSQIPPKKDEK